MTLIREIRLGEIIQTISLLVATVALLLKTIVDLFASYQQDPDTLAMFRRVDHDDVVYDAHFFGSPDEGSLDKLLLIFDRIATLYEMNAVSLADLDYVAYEFIRINDNSSVQGYFLFLDQWYAQRGLSKKAFEALRRVAPVLEHRNANRRRFSDDAADAPRRL